MKETRHTDPGADVANFDEMQPDLSFLKGVDRPALAKEFKHAPYGRHSDALQRLLTVMRTEPYAGRHVFLKEGRFGPYRLGRLGRWPGDDMRFGDEVFSDRASAEWALFKKRWRRLFAEEIE